VDRARTARRSANIEAARLSVHLVQAGIRTIAFARARRVAELILLYARRILEEEVPSLADRSLRNQGGHKRPVTCSLVAILELRRPAGAAPRKPSRAPTAYFTTSGR
jgi:ATP-dependent helicase YprA (DUF1998 family)